MNHPRIISMLPSATEIINCLGMTSCLVGRSHECDFPQEIQALPAVTFANIDTSKSSLSIDDEVKDRLKEGKPLYGIYHSLVQELKPDFIITQSHCEVCAVSLNEVGQLISKSKGLDAELIVLSPNRLSDIWTDIQSTSEKLGISDHGESVVQALRQRVTGIKQQADQADHHPRVAFIEWIDPLMAAGNWMPELITMAGGVNLFGIAERHSDWLKWTDLLTANPEIIIVGPCGFDLERTELEFETLKKHPGWSTLNAVQKGHVFVTDGNSFFNRSGPRLVESLELLAEIFHPSIFEFGHKNKNWKYASGS